MRRAIWPAFLASVMVGFGIFHLWGMTEIAFQTLDLIRSQIQEEPLNPLAAPTFHYDAAGRHISDIPFGVRDDDIMGMKALGIDITGDYAPLIMQNDGAVRAAGKNVQTGPKWVAIAVDKQGRVIVSPDSFLNFPFNLQPGERIIIEGPPAKVQP